MFKERKCFHHAVISLPPTYITKDCDIVPFSKLLKFETTLYLLLAINESYK